MNKMTAFVLAFAVATALAAPAQAKMHSYPHKHYSHKHYSHKQQRSHAHFAVSSARCVYDNNGRIFCADGEVVLAAVTSEETMRRQQRRNPILRETGCPAYLGCGCHLAVYLGLGPRRDLWLARNYQYEGHAASHGCIGCVAVLSRGHGGHVGIVRGYDANGNPTLYSYANPRLGWTTATYSERRVLAYRQL